MLALSPQVFAILSALIEERIGLHYSVADLDLLRDKVSARAEEAGFSSLLDYYYFLRYDPGGAAELQALTDALVVGETYFFREYDQLRVLTRTLIPEVLRRRGSARIWSAACASGEEPLSVAMLLAAEGRLGQVELVASDVSGTALARARAGRYGPRSLRQVPEPSLVRRYLREEAGAYLASRELVDAIDWRQVNLTDARQVAELGVFDVILCRNVLIYFRDATALRVLDHLSAALRPDGALLVSVSESLLRYGSGFDFEELGGAFVYRKATR